MSISRDIYDKAKKFVDKSEKILICVNNKSTFDTHAAAAALYFYLKDLKKNVSFVASGELIPRHEQLLKAYGIDYQKSLKPLNYVITLDHKEGGIDKVSFDDKEGKFYLYITPQADSKPFDFNKVNFSSGGSGYDAIFVFGARGLNWLEKLYTDNKALFNSEKVINVNNIEGAQSFGKVKLVETGISVCEIIQDFINHSSSASIDKIHELLLKGLLDCFQVMQPSDYKISTVDALMKLIKAGADLKLAIRDLYFQKDFASIKLAQKVMSNIKHDVKAGVVWSVVSSFDLSRSSVTRKNFDFNGRIVFNISKSFKVAFVIYEITNGEVWVEFESNEKGFDAKKILSEFNPVGNNYRVAFVVNDKSAAEVEDMVLAAIKQKLGVKVITPATNGYTEHVEAPEEKEPRVLTETPFSVDNGGNSLEMENESAGLVVPPPVNTSS